MLPQFSLFAVAACLGVASGFLQPREFDPARDLDLGTQASLEAFYEAIGTNSSDWEVITTPMEMETVDIEAAEAWNRAKTLRLSTSSSGVDPVRRQAPDFCIEEGNWMSVLCDNMPPTTVKWAVFGLTLIYYTPRVLNAWLDDLAVLVKQGFNLEARYIRQTNGNEGPERLKVRDTMVDAERVHFRLERPTTASLNTREESPNDHHVYTNLVLDTASMRIHTQGTSGSFNGFSAADLAKGEDHPEIQARQTQSNNYNIEVTIIRTTAERQTFASAGCIRQILNKYVHRSAKYHRYSCQEMHNRGTWRMAVGVFINQGAWNHPPNPVCC